MKGDTDPVVKIVSVLERGGTNRGSRRFVGADTPRLFEAAVMSVSEKHREALREELLEYTDGPWCRPGRNFGSATSWHSDEEYAQFTLFDDVEFVP